MQFGTFLAIDFMAFASSNNVEPDSACRYNHKGTRPPQIQLPAQCSCPWRRNFPSPFGVYMVDVFRRYVPEGLFMKAKKIAIIVGVVILLGAIVGFTVNQSQKNVVTVQTGKVYKQDIASVVTASGQIKPKTIVNVGANAMGRIVRLFVKEGEAVKKNQVLAQLENVQSAADVAMTRATVSSSQTDAVAAEAALNTAQAQLKSSTADFARAKLEYERAQNLYKDKLISKADYDTKQAAYEVADAVQ